MDRIIDLLISIAAVIATYLLTRRQNAFDRNLEQAKHRYECFYIQLFRLLYAGRYWEADPATMPFEARSRFLDLFTENIALLGLSLQACYPDLIDAYSHMLWFEENDSAYSRAPDEFRHVFKRIESAAISESKVLSKALSLPSISETYESYLGNSHVSNTTKQQR